MVVVIVTIAAAIARISIATTIIAAIAKPK